ncbi:hypothetical protein, partial [uncultured Rothia sp.]|uniref:hypothetical protein n=1 Tax=uncultured Rothia sp. TaxID=316088 RepID=UPI0026285CC4
SSDLTENRVILTKHPGTIAVFHKILLRNGVQLSDLAKFCSGTGYIYQISRKSAQELGTIIRISEILLRNGGQSSEFTKFCSGTEDNHQILR